MSDRLTLVISIIHLQRDTLLQLPLEICRLNLNGNHA